MNVLFQDDIDMIITALEHGDVDDAIQMLREIKEEQEADPFGFNNILEN